MNLILPTHFSFATDAIGLKTNGKEDVLAIFCEKEATVAGMFTQNTCPGAPVLVTKNHLEKTQSVRAILINAGIANVATGKKGKEDAELSSELLARSIGVPAEKVLVSSTGKIGEFLPMDLFAEKIPNLKNKKHVSVERASECIMTTDLVSKQACAEVGNAKIVGICKGSGMIAPNMATMLAFILTDAKVNTEKLQTEWKKIVKKTFNMVSVDNCESTSDMAIVFASNEYEVEEQAFYEKLEEVAKSLAKQIARDGEGATVLIECTVHAESEEDAHTFTKAVINSDLVKTAIHGKDPNWGRIAQALGGTHIPLGIESLKIYLDGEAVFVSGEPMNFDTSKMFASSTVKIEVYIGNALYSATSWGCDLSKEYITINALYHT